MGTVSKPNDFVPFTTAESAKVDANFDAIYSEFNGNISDANISATAGINQSKILNLASTFLTKMNKIGDTMTGTLSLFFGSPNILFKATGASVFRWLMEARVGGIAFDRSPQQDPEVFTTFYRLNETGTPQQTFDIANKAYVDSLTAGNAFAQVIKTNGNFTTTSTTFVGVSDLALQITTRARRIRVSVIATVGTDVAATKLYITLLLDGNNVNGGDGLVSLDAVSGKTQNASFTWTSTTVLTAAQHDVNVYMRAEIGSGSSYMIGNAQQAAILQVEELPLTT